MNNPRRRCDNTSKYDYDFRDYTRGYVTVMYLLMKNSNTVMEEMQSDHVFVNCGVTQKLNRTTMRQKRCWDTKYYHLGKNWSCDLVQKKV